MAKTKAVVYNDTLKDEYRALFGACVIKKSVIPSVDKIIARIETVKQEYLDVELATNVPWYFTAVIHNLECSGNFMKHLHNGDALTGRTYRVPAGRPLEGKPPFTWQESAIDALMMKSLDKWEDWSISGMLFKLEQYNGFGYRLYHPETKSPYLWSGSNIYVKGKYVRDFKWDPEAVSAQMGAAVVIKRMIENKVIELP